jgi:hypothetical protein
MQHVYMFPFIKLLPTSDQHTSLVLKSGNLKKYFFVKNDVW